MRIVIGEDEALLRAGLSHVLERGGFDVVAAVSDADELVQAVELHRRQDVLEQSVVVIDRDDFAARNVAQLGPILQKNRRRKLGQKGFGQVEVHVVPLESREHLDLHLRKDLAA